MADLLHMSQLDQPLAEQTQAPLSLPFWLFSTRQRDEVGFFLSIEDALLWPFRLLTSIERIV